MRRRACQRLGFSLVEVALALGIASFCLLAVFALLPAAISTNQATVQQTVDTNLADGIAADLRATPRTTPPSNQNSPRYGITVPASGTVSHTIFLREDGAPTGAQDADADPAQSKYRATIFLSAPSGSQRTATTARILMTWPALADKSAGPTPSKYTGSYETFTAMDRN